MKKIILIFAVLFLTVNLRSEYLFLKDGLIIKGSIISDKADSISFRNDEGKVLRYPRDKILRLLYTELNMGRVFVQRRDGKVDTVYMVDEDRITYTFRKDLYKPVEFTMKRADVLFMAERNPTGLKGEPGIDEVALEWLPSFEKMKHYNIYLKKKGGNYGLPMESKKVKYNLDDLASNTEYTVKVTGYAGDGDETTPSNEYTFRTINLPPVDPGGVTISPIDNGKTRIAWEPASDPDGKVVKYQIYTVNGKATTLIGETTKLEYTVNDKIFFDRLIATAVDDRGAESSPGGIRIVPLPMVLSLSAGTIIPMGNFSDISGIGYGGTLSLREQNFFITGLDTGISAGFYYMQGKGDPGSETESIQSTGRAFFIPVSLNAGYRLNITKTISVLPYISAGGAYLDMLYTERDSNSLLDTEKHLRTFGPIAGAGISFDYLISKSVYLFLRSEAGLMIHKDISGYPFMKFELAAGYKI